MWHDQGYDRGLHFGRYSPRHLIHNAAPSVSAHHILKIRLPYGKAECELVILPYTDKISHLRQVYARPGTYRNVIKGPILRVRPCNSHSSALLLAWSGINFLQTWQSVQRRFTVSRFTHDHYGSLKHDCVFTASHWALDKLRGNLAFYLVYSKP